MNHKSYDICCTLLISINHAAPCYAGDKGVEVEMEPDTEGAGGPTKSTPKLPEQF